MSDGRWLFADRDIDVEMLGSSNLCSGRVFVFFLDILRCYLDGVVGGDKAFVGEITC